MVTNSNKFLYLQQLIKQNETHTRDTRVTVNKMKNTEPLCLIHKILQFQFFLNINLRFQFKLS